MQPTLMTHPEAQATKAGEASVDDGCRYDNAFELGLLLRRDGFGWNRRRQVAECRGGSGVAAQRPWSDWPPRPFQS